MALSAIRFELIVCVADPWVCDTRMPEGPRIPWLLNSSVPLSSVYENGASI